MQSYYIHEFYREEIDANNPFSVQELVIAARHGHVNEVRGLLNQQVNPIVRPFTDIGYSALEETLIRPFTPERAACINLMLPMAINDLLRAVLFEDYNCIRSLLMHGVNPDMYPSFSPLTIIQTACLAGLPNSVWELREFSHIETSLDELNRNLIHLVCMSGSKETMEILWNMQREGGQSIKDAVNVNAIDDLGNTPLHYSVLYGCDGMIKYLVKIGGFNELRNSNGQTATKLAGEKFANGRIRNESAYKILSRESALRRRFLAAAFNA
jgi:ankyrin repeat protein